MADDKLHEAIQGLYDAALRPEMWSEAIGRVAALVNRGQAILEHLNYETGEGRWLGLYGYELRPENKELLSLMLEHDPWAAKLRPGWFSEHTLGAVLLEERERQKTFFVNELAPIAHLETRDILATFVTRSSERPGQKATAGALMIYSNESQGPFDAQEVALIAKIRPHLVRALEMQTRLEGARINSELQLSLLDRLASGVWLIGRDGEVLLASAGANALHDRGDMQLRDGRLHMADSDYDRLLQRAIGLAKSGLVSQTDGAFLAPSITGGRPLNVVVTPLAPPSAASLILGYSGWPAALVAASDSDPQLDLKVEATRRTYGLTEAETRVLRGFMTGISLADIAAQSGSSVHTVRTQVKSIMDKTETNSQRMLMALVYGAAF